jgi:23S rRNA-/tRNA-specific pseudouridylate synthase
MSLANPWNPPVLRHGFVTDRALSRAELLRELRARLQDVGWSSERIASLLWHGGVHLAGHPFDTDTLPDALPARTSVMAYAFAFEPERVLLPQQAILWEASGVVAVNKPPWMTVQGTRASRRLSLEVVLRERLQCDALRAVHRLDRETSGLVLFARDRETAARLGRELAAGRLKRRYLAVVSPRPQKTRWEVRGFLARRLHPTRFRFALYDTPGANRRDSFTRFVQLAARDDTALVLAEPGTGRTHQIRVHLENGGTPIVGDALYGSTVECVPPARPLRTQLHALWLRAQLDPMPGAPPLELVAPIPRDFGQAFAWTALPFLSRERSPAGPLGADTRAVSAWRPPPSRDPSRCRQ